MKKNNLSLQEMTHKIAEPFKEKDKKKDGDKQNDLPKVILI